ncbi:hypothetical protein [Terracidiphilus gabretensis]|jgi:hypothetical protein|uniref:hypothetical protein n=1 Tax=Terracidiphilus gabretensis TaxID=1577687 RepID=UPI00071B2C70|nr:hypothetical protein [Terracidiphilus gabretensis]
MEADWEFEIGADVPIIDAHWESLVDLTAHPEKVTELPEAADFPQLADALVRLNGPHSAVRTSKCDLWPVDLDEESLDADELDASPGMAEAAWACYIDLTARDPQRWENPDTIRQDCVALCAQLRLVSLRCCRADLVIRRAVVAGGDALGVTAYLTACSQSEEHAKNVLKQALHAFADSALAVPAN